LSQDAIHHDGEYAGHDPSASAGPYGSAAAVRIYGRGEIEIAKKYLVPRQLRESGLTAEQAVIPDETLRALISGYTREAGLRRLERAIGRLTRKVALRFAEGDTQHVTFGQRI
jgi:ATP-dependent Lon protease